MNWQHGPGARPTWADVAVPYGSPRELCAVVGKHIRYRAEPKDHWREAPDTWARGAGDCEDFSLVIQALCQVSQFEVRLFAYLPKGTVGSGHVVPVGRWNGQLWFANNGAYREVDSEEDLKRDVANSLAVPANSLSCMELSDALVAGLIAKAKAEGGPGLPT